MNGDFDIVICNGRVIDTAQGLDGIRSVGIRGQRIAAISEGSLEGEFMVDAKDCIVVPGLIDFHTHLYAGGSEFGLKADYMLSQGTTSAVDAGTAGTAGFEAFYASQIVHSSVNIKAFLSIGATGLSDPKHPQNYEPSLINIKRIGELKEKYPDTIIGLKVSLSRHDVGDLGIQPLKTAVGIAREIGNLAVCVHSTDPPEDIPALLACLRPGDILAHCYHGTGHTILGPGRKVSEAVWEGRARGILFDVANGISHFSHETALAAIRDGFYPDIVSSDLVSFAFGRSKRNKSLPYVMSKLHAMGMDLQSLIRAATETPAKLMGLEGRAGTLRQGAWADVAVLKEKPCRIQFEDSRQAYFEGTKLFVPQLTLKNGRTVFCQTDFNL